MWGGAGDVDEAAVVAMAVADPNGGTLRYEYQVFNSTKTTVMATSGKSVTGVKNNASRTWVVNKDLATGQYYWRGRGCDVYVCGAYSGWSGFRVDTTNPKLPSVTSSLYSQTGWHGAPGQAGPFTFRPGAAADGVSAYEYSLNGGPVTRLTPGTGGVGTVTVVPARDLYNLVRVEAIDTAGNRSGHVDYWFKVRPIGDSWYWSFDDAVGGVAPSAPENNRPSTVRQTGITWPQPGRVGDAAASFAGNGDMLTAVPVVDTSAASGFTVAAWVRLPAPPPEESDADDPPPVPDEPAPGDPGGDDPEGEDTPPDIPAEEPVTAALPTVNQTAVSADGARASAFRLGYRVDVDVDGDLVADPAWCFTIAAQDMAPTAETRACTTAYVTAGDWVHLVGVVDAPAGRIRLYVNGTADKDGVLVDVPGRMTWEAGGVLAFARARSNNLTVERWVGDIDEVHAAPRVWTSVEINDKAGAE